MKIIFVLLFTKIKKKVFPLSPLLAMPLSHPIVALPGHPVSQPPPPKQLYTTNPAVSHCTILPRTPPNQSKPKQN